MDEIDLSNAELFCSDASGVYIPQRFANEVIRDFLSGVKDEDMNILAAGPEHEHYWDAWADVLDNAVITDRHGKVWVLHQDGDLWVLPKE